MMNYYDDEVLQEINNNTDLLSYAQQTLELKQRGNDYFAHCPLHRDDTPSLSFSPEKNSFYCFSCGVKGQMIGYLMKFEKLSFDEAVEKASKLAEIDISKMCQSKTMNFLKKWKLFLKSRQNTEVFQHLIVPISDFNKFTKAKVTEWLDEGITQETIDLFDIRIDEYGNRIVYPVYDINNNLINIKGRTRYKNYKALKIQKYMNYYKVGVMDYFQCLNVTLRYVKEKKEIIIFESIKSVMKAYGWGYRNCVSAEKHNLTPEQISLLVKLKVNIVLAYDSDVSYGSGEIFKNIDKLRKVTNIYIINDMNDLLGGSKAKNAPVDCGKEIWEELYNGKKKVV